jgi:hypothetical protein
VICFELTCRGERKSKRRRFPVRIGREEDAAIVLAAAVVRGRPERDDEREHRAEHEYPTCELGHCDLLRVVAEKDKDPFAGHTPEGSLT